MTKTEKPFWSSVISSPARLFAVGGIGIFILLVVTFLSRYHGTVAVDMYREDKGFFNVAHFYLFDPVILGVLALVYWSYARFLGKRPKRTLVAIHFWISIAFAVLVIYLAHDTVDLPIPDWRAEAGPHLANQARLFLLARLAFISAQVIFVANLLWTSISSKKGSSN